MKSDEFSAKSMQFEHNLSIANKKMVLKMFSIEWMIHERTLITHRMRGNALRVASSLMGRPACDHHNLNIDRTENINKQIDTRKLFQTVLPKDLTFIFSFQVRLINCILQGIYEFRTFLSNYHNNNLYKDWSSLTGITKRWMLSVITRIEMSGEQHSNAIYCPTRDWLLLAIV